MQVSPEPIAILASLGQPKPEQVTPVYGGSATLIWRVEYANRSFALRVLKPSQVSVWQREQVAHAYASRAGVVVPQIHEAGVWEGFPALLMDWCAGEPLIQVLQRQPWQIWRLGRAFGRAQAAIHNASPPTEWPADAWIERAGVQTEPIRQHMLAREMRQPALLHFDYHPLNVLTDGKTITAVLDWANAASGDPRADLARTYTILRVEPIGEHESIALRTWRILLCQSWRAGYTQARGPCAIEPLFLAWAGSYMLRDLGGRLSPSQRQKVEHWAAKQWRTAVN